MGVERPGRHQGDHGALHCLTGPEKVSVCRSRQRLSWRSAPSDPLLAGTSSPAGRGAATQRGPRTLTVSSGAARDNPDREVSRGVACEARFARRPHRLSNETVTGLPACTSSQRPRSSGSVRRGTSCGRAADGTRPGPALHGDVDRSRCGRHRRAARAARGEHSGSSGRPRVDVTRIPHSRAARPRRAGGSGPRATSGQASRQRRAHAEEEDERPARACADLRRALNC